MNRPTADLVLDYEAFARTPVLFAKRISFRPAWGLDDWGALEVSTRERGLIMRSASSVSQKKLDLGWIERVRSASSVSQKKLDLGWIERLALALWLFVLKLRRVI